MNRYWDEVRELFGLLAYTLKTFGEGRIELCFTISESHYEANNTTTLSHYMRRIHPAGTSNIERSLRQILEPYLEKAVRARGQPKGFRTKRSVRPLSIYVLTDGVWEPNSNPAGFLTTLKSKAHSLTDLDDRRIGIQFIQFGDDERGADRLQFLDNECDFDIVDTERSDGDVLKMLLGSIDERYDQAAYSSFPNELTGPRAEELESDLEDDIFSDGFSNASGESASSATSNESHDQRQAAYKILYEALTSDPNIKALFQKASQQSLITRGEFEKRVRNFLIEFAVDLGDVPSKLSPESRSLLVRFVKNSSKRLSKDLADMVLASKSTSIDLPGVSKANADNQNDEYQMLLRWLSEIEQKQKSPVEDHLPPVSKLSSVGGNSKSITNANSDPWRFESFTGIELDKDVYDSSSEDGGYASVTFAGDVLISFLKEKHAFENLTTNLRRFLTRYFYDWPSIDTQWRRELLNVALLALRHSRLNDVQFYSFEKSGLLDQLQMSLESFTGLSWNWAPFPPPVYPVKDGKVRIKWLCVSSKLLSTKTIRNPS